MTAVNLNPPQFHAWMSDAACAEYPGDMWFADKGGSDHLEEAKKICASCPRKTREECTDYAIDNDEKIGLWGGLTPTQLRRLREKRRAVA